MRENKETYEDELNLNVMLDVWLLFWTVSYAKIIQFGCNSFANDAQILIWVCRMCIFRLLAANMQFSVDFQCSNVQLQ